MTKAIETPSTEAELIRISDRLCAIEAAERAFFAQERSDAEIDAYLSQRPDDTRSLEQVFAQLDRPTTPEGARAVASLALAAAPRNRDSTIDCAGLAERAAFMACRFLAAEDTPEGGS